MNSIPSIRRTIFTATACLLSVASAAQAADGDPLAVRRWSGGAVSVETHWGLHVVVDPNEKATKQLPGKPNIEVRCDSKYDHVLYRLPNQAKTDWAAYSSANKFDANALRIKSVEVGESSGLHIQVDGTRLLFLTGTTTAALEKSLAESKQRIDLLVISLPANSALADWTSTVNTIKPRRILLNPVASIKDSDVAGFRDSLKTKHTIRNVDHNTLAVSSTKQKMDGPEICVTTVEPWVMPADLAKLFAGMEKSCSDSQAVFAKLSVDQLNFKPANGTHTPRWNTEHMMGRQLLFFSQIYNKIDPAIRVMDLNPKQMPPDYVFAHPKWDGQEEARQTQRVSDFTRRFAYLLDGLNVKQRAPGSRWPSLRALLLQMQRHYGEHTKNTVKKYSLPGFPKD